MHLISINRQHGFLKGLLLGIFLFLTWDIVIGGANIQSKESITSEGHSKRVYISNDNPTTIVIEAPDGKKHQWNIKTAVNSEIRHGKNMNDYFKRVESPVQSPNGKWLLVIGRTNTDAFGDHLILISTSEEKGRIIGSCSNFQSTPVWNEKESMVAVECTNEMAGYQYLIVVDLQKKQRVIEINSDSLRQQGAIGGDLEVNVENPTWAKNGEELYFSITEPVIPGKQTHEWKRKLKLDVTRGKISDYE